MNFKFFSIKPAFLIILTIFLISSLGLTSCSKSGTDVGPDPDLVEDCVSTIDCDGDGMSDACDSAPTNPSVSTPTGACDSDGDGYVDIACAPSDTDGNGEISTDELDPRTLCDNCIGTSNPDQADSDKDHFGDACDLVNCTDDDGDTVCDDVDNCAGLYNPDQTADADADGTGDACDDDIDGDGLANESDNCPEVDNVDQADSDGDGTGDVCDDDSDGDGIADEDDECPDQGIDESLQENVTNPDSWDGCCYKTDPDPICDHEEVNGCVLVANVDADNDGYDDCADTDGDGTPDGDDDDIDGDGLENDVDLCPENDEDGWRISILEIHVDKSDDGACTKYKTIEIEGEEDEVVLDFEGYNTTLSWNGVDSTYCAEDKNYTKDDLIDAFNVLIPIYGFLTFGAIDPTGRHIKGSYEGIDNMSKATNYGDVPGTCTESKTSDDNAFRRIVCGTVQNVDANGKGAACPDRQLQHFWLLDSELIKQPINIVP